jgi:hypothetical protein
MATASATNGGAQDEMRLQHTHRNADINMMVQVAVIDTMSQPGTKLLKSTEQEIRLQKTRTIDKNIASLLKLPHKIVYEEITKFDEENKMFTMETHLEMPSQHTNPSKRKHYTLDVITAYEENRENEVDVKARLLCGGVARHGLMHMGLTAYVKEQFKTGRQAEAIALMRK